MNIKETRMLDIRCETEAVQLEVTTTPVGHIVIYINIDGVCHVRLIHTNPSQLSIEDKISG